MRFADACNLAVCRLIRQAYNMPNGSVRPANQAIPTGAESEEFATVAVLSLGPEEFCESQTFESNDFADWSPGESYSVGDNVKFGDNSFRCTAAVIGGTGPETDTAHWALTGSPTTMWENVDSLYKLTTSVQFFRHTRPGVDEAGLAKWGLGAFDKAARMEAIMWLSPNVELCESLGLGLDDVSEARNVSALVDGGYWDDRGSVDLTFTVLNRESVLINSFTQAGVTLQVAEPGHDPDTIQIEVTP